MHSTASCGELNCLIAGIAVEATTFELVINHQDRQPGPSRLPAETVCSST